MTTGGGFGLVASFSGSITATPSCVGNHSLPSRVLHPAGHNPPLHSILRMPSRFPYGMEVMVLLLPAAKSFSCLFADTIDPLIAAHPEVAPGVLEYLEYTIAEEPFPNWNIS